jgi:polysaccharide chain length determinant protein (PEP-CTERM system associated)
LTDEVNKLRVELRAAEQSRDAYRRELSAEDPQLPADLATKDSNPINSPVLEAEARLDAQKKSLDELLRRYTDAHPDVISTRRAIGQLELEVRTRQEAEQRRLAKLGKAAKAATSPVYQKLRISLADTEAQVASLRSKLAAQQGQLDRVRSVAGRLPQVEAELAQLNRDYDIIRKNYDLMVARRESATLGVKLDESSQLAEFRIIEPPRVSPSPIFPSRLHLALIAVVASMALGLAAALASEFMWPTIDEATSLQLFSGRPVLGTVSKLVTPQGRRAQRMSLLLFAAAVAALMALQALWVASMAAKVPL